MKTFVAILLFVAVFFLKSTSLAADAVRVSPSPIELELKCGITYSNKYENDKFVEFVEFGKTRDVSTNIAMQVIFRNVGEKSVWVDTLIPHLSIVWDGKEYKQTLRNELWDVPPVSPHSATDHYYFLSDFNIPPEARSPGRHTVAVRDEFSETNTFTLVSGETRMQVVLETLSEPPAIIYCESNRLIFAESTTLTVFIENPK